MIELRKRTEKRKREREREFERDGASVHEDCDSLVQTFKAGRVLTIFGLGRPPTITDLAMIPLRQERAILDHRFQPDGREVLGRQRHL